MTLRTTNHSTTLRRTIAAVATLALCIGAAACGGSSAAGHRGAPSAASPGATHTGSRTTRTTPAASVMQQVQRGHARAQAIVDRCTARAQAGGGRAALISCLAAHGLKAPATPNLDACLKAAGSNVTAILACSKTGG
jgi:hypothetical protein